MSQPSLGVVFDVGGIAGSMKVVGSECALGFEIGRRDVYFSGLIDYAGEQGEQGGAA